MKQVLATGHVSGRPIAKHPRSRQAGQIEPSISSALVPDYYQLLAPARAPSPAMPRTQTHINICLAMCAVPLAGRTSLLGAWVACSYPAAAGSAV